MIAPEFRYQVDAAGTIREQSGDLWQVAGKAVLDGVQRPTWLGPLTACERDLLRVTAALLDADRLSRRRVAMGPRAARDLCWPRRIHVEMSVEDPSRWTVVQASLARLLFFMTDDTWELSFVGAARPAQQQVLPQIELGDADEVALFSGGLDSVAGLYARSLETRGRFVVVSACGNDVRGRAQSAALAALHTLGVNARPLKLVHQLRDPRRRRSSIEVSQRSRGLLFLAMGAVVASRFAKPSFSVYETGVGCINLPMSGAQVGSQGTRAMHPRTLALFDELLKAVLDHPVSVVAPNFLRTKGELCRIAGDALGSLAAVASSCDEGDGHKPAAMEHCGVCTSCLFRRIAIFSAGQRDPSTYRDFIMRSHGRYEQITFDGHARDLLACKSFAGLVELDPNVRFAARLPLFDTPGPLEAQAEVFAMYRRYAAEIVTFFEQARPTLTDRPHAPRKEDRDLFAAVG